jgi:chemotaxis protein CheD
MILKAGLNGIVEKIHSTEINQVVNGYRTLSIVGGEFAVVSDAENVAIKTLLGSCVAMMFYDTRMRVMSMNHFLLPEATGSNSLKFGLYSVEAMINEMYKLGCSKQNMVAKIAGGGHILATHDNRIGDKNVDFALNFCNSEGFRIESEHTKGENGRVILLASEFQTFIRVVKNKAVEAEIEAQEKQLNFQNKPIAASTTADSDITFF